MSVKIISMKKRLDTLIVERGLAASRERAKALVMEGRVLVDGRPAGKPGSMLDEAAAIVLKEPDIPYVGRRGLKLMAAIERFGIDLRGKTAMDVGAGTGGFTDVMLRMGARKVYSIDVGYGQFDWRLRNDPRVILIERANIRYLERERVPEEIDIATVDVSFISLKTVMPKVLELIKPGGEIAALIKPQFEVGKGEVGKGGIVRDEGKRLKAVEETRQALADMGFDIIGLMESPVKGQKGNIEYLIYLKGGTDGRGKKAG